MVNNKTRLTLTLVTIWFSVGYPIFFYLTFPFVVWMWTPTILEIRHPIDRWVAHRRGVEFVKAEPIHAERFAGFLGLVTGFNCLLQVIG